MKETTDHDRITFMHYSDFATKQSVFLTYINFKDKTVVRYYYQSRLTRKETTTYLKVVIVAVIFEMAWSSSANKQCKSQSWVYKFIEGSIHQKVFLQQNCCTLRHFHQSQSVIIYQQGKRVN